jgi:hypothetical protein
LPDWLIFDPLQSRPTLSVTKLIAFSPRPVLEERGIVRAAYHDEIVATDETIALVGEQIDITNAQVTAGASAYSAVLTLENEHATLDASLPALAQKEVQAGDLLASLAGQFPFEWRAQPVSLADITLPADLPQTVAVVARAQTPFCRQRPTCTSRARTLASRPPRCFPI